MTIRMERAYFQSRGTTNEHPAGDGWRDLLVYTYDDGDVMTISLPHLHSKMFSESAWKNMRPRDLDMDAHRVLATLRDKRDSLPKQGVAFEPEPVEQAIALLQELVSPPPPPRIRTRARLDAPTPPVQGLDVADHGTSPVPPGDVHP